MLDSPHCSGVLAGRVSPRRATHFLLRRQEKVSKEKATRWSGSLRFAAGNLRCSVKAGSRSNSASPQTIASPDPLLPALLGPARRVGGEKTNTAYRTPPECRKREALPARESQVAVMFARESSTHGQMRFPSIAQRGEGGVRGGSGELDPTAQCEPEAQRDAGFLQAANRDSSVMLSTYKLRLLARVAHSIRDTNRATRVCAVCVCRRR